MLERCTKNVLQYHIFPFLGLVELSRLSRTSQHLQLTLSKPWNWCTVIRFHRTVSNTCLRRFCLRLPQLQTLKLAGGARLTDDGCIFLNRLRALKKLTITGICLSSYTLSLLQDLPLIHLMLRDCRNIRSLAELRHLKLQRLELECLNHGQLDVITQCGLSTFRQMKLTHLALVECVDAGLVHFSGMQIRHLRLSNSWIHDFDLVHCVRMPLEHLDLNFCLLLTDDMFIHLQHTPTLRYLDVRYNPNITGAGFTYLSKLPRLEVLLLSGTRHVTGRSLSFLSELPLHQLDLRRCENITDHSLRFLRRCPLSSLDLSYCSRLTEQGVLYLVGLSLHHLMLDGCPRISPLAMYRLRHIFGARPGVRCCSRFNCILHSPPQPHLTYGTTRQVE